MWRRNPAAASKQAEDLYESFHKYGPKRLGEFRRLKIPRRARAVGEAINVRYLSMKVDPDTYVRPKKPVGYIHEHEGGVLCCRCSTREGKSVDVPDWIYKTDGLVRLGDCLGFTYDDGVNEIDAESTGPYPTLYAIPSGKALLVIGDEQVLAMMWGGELDVRPEGIVG